ncbi:putative glutaredoxin-C9-like [Capsicum annuum]|uniref:guanylate-binding protein 4-like n=1 Tax=Capsicum annuum TaxID=4072 RepID=UPI001FB1577C|nr:guanylate-binding protein 4-like [Capsicum annuum]KAF3656719.1 putative glutaredoxin-C9-like [Capsicum annuum]
MRRLFVRGSAGDSPPQQSPSPSPPQSSVPSSVNIAAGPARPIRFVYCDEKGKFQIDPEALAILQLVKEPVGIVSVCGRARQGKSFILNQLLGRSSGFQVAATHRPCTKGIWLWSAPLRRTSLDGAEYNLLLLDTEGIDAYDQTGTYSTQIFSLAVLLSSMFVYNQMGGIDEAALDRLSLVTEMTKHIRVRASGGRASASELGQFSPIFVWLLRDFYLDLVEDNCKITPRDYLELALRPVQGGGKDVAAKNEIRDSIRALFPDRECFPLVRPLSNENELQRLDQIPLENLRPEFKAGLDALTRFVFERTRPKQVGATIMTGPLFARITQSFLDALNNGAVPTITSSWQSVEEAECQRAYDLAADRYMASFDRSKPPEEGALREAHEDAAQKSMAEFNSTAVGAGSIRMKYEKRLQNFIKKAFEELKKDAFREAYLQCSNAIRDMEKDLRIACHAPDANIDSVLKVLDRLVSKYEATCQGPEKWRKLIVFLQQSLEGPLFDLIKKQTDQLGSEKTTLALKCRSIEDKMNLLNKQLEASEKYKSEYLKRYEDAINVKKQLADDYTSRITNLQSKYSSLEERYSSLSKMFTSAKHESAEWKRKYEQLLLKQKADEDQSSAEVSVLKSRTAAAEARLAAAKEQAESAQEEAEEWKRKYDIAVKEVKIALEKAASAQERANKETQLREDALRDEFSSTLSDKEEEIKDKTSKLEQAEQRLATLSLELRTADSKVKNYALEVSALKVEIKELVERLENANATAQSFEREAKILEQEKVHLEQKYRSEFDRFEDVQDRYKSAETEAKRATELADKARAEAATALKEKNEIQRLAMERLAQIEKAARAIEKLEREREDLADEVGRHHRAEKDARSKVAMLEARVEEREKEIEMLLKSNNEQRASTVQVLESLLETERVACAEANNRSEALSVQLQATQGKLDLLQQQLTAVRLNETALDSKLRTASHGKRGRIDEYEAGFESVHDMDTNDRPTRGNKRSKSTTSPLKFSSPPEDGGSVFRGDDNAHSQQTNGDEDYTKFTVQKLKQELTKHNFGAELLQLKNANKKDILALYEKCILQKS